MAEYYGYAERDANAYVDWGKLGQNLTETVQTAYKIREDRKAELDKLMEDNYAALANTPTGENKDINGAVLQHADNSKQYLLKVNKLLKAGILKPKDYTLINQNLGEDTKALFNNAKGWQDAYSAILEGTKNNTLSKAMLDISSDVAAFGKFKNLDIMINPVTGRMSAAQMTTGPNGEQIKGDSKSMQQLNVLMNQKIEKYQLTDVLAKAETRLGNFTHSELTRAAIQKQGSIINVKDKAIKDTFEAAKITYLKEVMANPFNVMSILMDHAGVRPGTDTPYRVSTDKNDKGKPDVIFYHDPDGDGSYTPELTAAQRDAAEKYATDQFVGMIDREEEYKVTGQVSRDERSAEGNAQQRLNERSAEIGRQIGLLMSGTDTEKRAATSFLNNQKDTEGKSVFGKVIMDNTGKVYFYGTDGKRVDAFDVSGVNKENAGMQLYSMFENFYGDKGLNTEIFRKEMLKSGGKEVVLPKGSVYTQTENWEGTTTGADGTIDTSVY